MWTTDLLRLRRATAIGSPMPGCLPNCEPNVLHGRPPLQALRASAPLSIIASTVLSPGR